MRGGVFPYLGRVPGCVLPALPVARGPGAGARFRQRSSVPDGPSMGLHHSGVPLSPSVDRESLKWRAQKGRNVKKKRKKEIQVILQEAFDLYFTENLRRVLKRICVQSIPVCSDLKENDSISLRRMASLHGYPLVPCTRQKYCHAAPPLQHVSQLDSSELRQEQSGNRLHCSEPQCLKRSDHSFSTQCTPLQDPARSRLLAEETVQAYLLISYLWRRPRWLVCNIPRAAHS